MILSSINVLTKYKDYDPSPNLNRLTSIPSQTLLVSYKDRTFSITLDSGATVSYLKLSVAQALGLKIAPNNQLALLADQKTRMASMGEVDFNVSMGSVQMRVRALIMKNLQAQCFGGTTFHADNDIETRIKSGTVKIHGRFLVDQSNPHELKETFPPPSEQLPHQCLLTDSPITDTNFSPYPEADVCNSP